MNSTSDVHTKGHSEKRSRREIFKLRIKGNLKDDREDKNMRFSFELRIKGEVKVKSLSCVRLFATP